MNKIFKIVWNAARGKMMVVNETTSSVQTGKKAAVAVIATALMAASATVSAGITTTGTQTIVGDLITVTGDATLEGATYFDKNIHFDGNLSKQGTGTDHLGVQHTVEVEGNINLDTIYIYEGGSLKVGGSLTASEYIKTNGPITNLQGNPNLGTVTTKIFHNYSDAGLTITDFNLSQALENTQRLTVDKIGAENAYVSILHNVANSDDALTVTGDVYAKSICLNNGSMIVGGTTTIKDDWSNTYGVGDSTLKTNSLVIAGSANLNNLNIVTDSLKTATGSLTIGEGTTISTKSLETAATVMIYDDARFTDELEKVVFTKVENASNAPRIQLMGKHGIQIKELVVESTPGTEASGNEAMLVDRMAADSTSSTSFEIDKVSIAEGAELSIVSHKRQATGTADVVLGAVNMDVGSKLNVGFRSDDFTTRLGNTTIDTLTLGEDAVVDVKSGTKDENGTFDGTENADITINEINIEGNGAKVDGNLIGENTSISVGDGVEGASIAKISAEKAVIDVETPTEQAGLSIGAVAEGSAVQVTTAKENNTGDLTALSKSVSVEDGEVQLSIEENDVYGAMSGTLDKTGLSDVVQAVNTKTQAVADQVTLAPQMITRIMMNDVRKRMGDLRAAEGTHGVWARYNGGQMAGSGMEADFNMIQVGIDTVPVADAPRFGVAFSYAQTEADATNGLATTDMDAFSLAFYGTKMYDNGMFVDVIGRMATVDADMNVSGNKGKMDNVALSLSGELGWRFDVADRFFIEPSAELTYTYTNADTFTMGTGKYELEATDSLVGRAGFAAGFKCPANKGDVYVRAAVVHEFMGDVTMNSWGANGNAATPIETDGEDTYFEYAVGAQFNINKNTYVYADVERTEGANVDEDWRANVGVRFAF